MKQISINLHFHDDRDNPEKFLLPTAVVAANREHFPWFGVAAALCWWHWGIQVNLCVLLCERKEA